MKSKVPIQDLNAHLRGYRASLLREYSNNEKHVFFSRPMGQWITVTRKGNSAQLEFTDFCPCGEDD